MNKQVATIRNINFAMYSSIKIGDRVDVKVIEDENFDICKYSIIGKSNNIILTPNHPPLAMLSKKFSYIKIHNNKLIIGGATPNGKIFSFCKNNNIKHFECFRALPGSLGGMVKMNAGMKEYEIFNHLLEVKINNKYVKKEDISYSYRHTNINGIIYEAVFSLQYGFSKEQVDMFDNMRKNQPQMPSAGSCFKNPEGYFAGKLIDDVGLKGYKIGDICFSQKHANFLVNLGKAKSSDALELINLAKKRVKDMFDIELELEIVIL